MEITTIGTLMDKVLRCSYCGYTVDIPDAFSIKEVNETDYFKDSQGNIVKQKTTKIISRVDGSIHVKDHPFLELATSENPELRDTLLLKTGKLYERSVKQQTIPKIEPTYIYLIRAIILIVTIIALFVFF